MPIIKSAFKHLKQTRKKTVVNVKVKRELKDFVKNVRKAAEAKDKTKLHDFAGKIQKIVDKAAKKKIIKQNTAARYKSRLTTLANRVLSA